VIFVLSTDNTILAGAPAVLSSSDETDLPLFFPTALILPFSKVTSHKRGESSAGLGLLPSDLPFKKSSTSSQLL
jgi:hypothetical protein